MPRDPANHTPIQRFRLDQHTWDHLGEVAGSRGRTAVIADLIRWYLREPGAKQPDRPPRRTEPEN